MTDLIKRDDAPEPCPFCKCEEVTTWLDYEQGEKWGYATCDGCAARGPDVRTNYSRGQDTPWRSEAIAAWNTRTHPAIAPAAIREAALREAANVCLKSADEFYDPDEDGAWEARSNANAILALIGETK